MRKDLHDVSKFEKMFREFIDIYAKAEPEAQEEERKRQLAENTLLEKHSLQSNQTDSNGKTIHIHIS